MQAVGQQFDQPNGRCRPDAADRLDHQRTRKQAIKPSAGLPHLTDFPLGPRILLLRVPGVDSAA